MTAWRSLSVWRLLSLLFDYPDAELAELDADLERAARELPAGPCRDAVLAFMARRGKQSLVERQREYVETFDFAGRNTLYLSFHTYGDRRQRGMAMLHLKQLYRHAGLELAEGILPDHLPVICEFAAVAPERGTAILADFGPSLKAIAAALHEQDSAFAGLLDGLISLLPEAAQPLETVQLPEEDLDPDADLGFEADLWSAEDPIRIPEADPLCMPEMDPASLPPLTQAGFGLR